MRRRGSITDEEALSHPQKHVITRALGIGDSVCADLIPVDVKENDCVLLCTDGLTNLVSNDEIKDVILQNYAEQEAAQKLVQMANDRGGYDNITVLIARYLPKMKESR